MEKLFENGYLKSEYINPNYRGLVGWDCIHTISMESSPLEDSGFKSLESNAKIICYHNNVAYIETQGSSTLVCPFNMRIPKFTLLDIPVGELCWVWCTFYLRWDLLVLRKVDLKSDNPQYLFNHWEQKGFVPYLIAETAEKAQWIVDNTDWCQS